MTALERARELVAEHPCAAAFTGAGVSTASGVPDFRSPGGIWSRYKPVLFQDFVLDPEARRQYWIYKKETYQDFADARPNPAHRALARMEAAGRLRAVITQNIDGLHQRAGNSSDKVIEVHGTVHDVICMSCGWRAPMRVALDRVRAGEEDPPCRTCGGILKSATISFGQSLIPAVIERAMRAASEADLLLAIGTSLQVYPIAGAVPLASAHGARIVIVNAEPTPFDEVADAVLRMPIGEVLPVLCDHAV